MPYLPATGLTWLLKAAEQNNLYAFFWLGHVYDSGTMFARDPVQALAWYVLATKNTPSVMFPDAMVAARDELAKELTLKQRATAQAIAARWLLDHPAKDTGTRGPK
jgi:TPR repeat protein